MKNGKRTLDLKNQIIDSAQEVFAKYGLKKTTMDEIAAGVNKAKGALYYYFGSKEEVYEAVVEKEAAIFKEEISNAINIQAHPRERLKAYTQTRMKLFFHLSNFYSAYQEENMGNYLFIQQLRAKYDKEEVKIIMSILKDGEQEYDLQIGDLSITAQVVLIGLKGFEYEWSMETDISRVEKYVATMLDILFLGLQKR
jgi:AcrR family transcriptional regulator